MNQLAPRSQPAWFEKQIEAFECDWRTGSSPDLASFVAAVHEGSDAASKELLEELIKVDLEYRWRDAKRHSRRGKILGSKLETYIKRFPQLGRRDDLPLDLIREEYVARQRFGDQPTHAEFHARFSRHGLQLTLMLEAADQEIECESSTAALQTNHERQTAAPAIDPTAPLSHSDFQLQRQIGAGGICKVYTALQRSLDKPVAVKVLKKRFLNDDRHVSRFLNEAKIAAQFRHPNIVGVHGVGRFPDGGYFMVMDLVCGRDLSRVHEQIPDFAADIPRIIFEIANTIHDVHEQGIVHCDLKPSNVLLSWTEQIAVTDFGFAQTLDQSIEKFGRSSDGGTIAFMAPEQFDRQFGTVDRHTDIYAIGGIIYALITGSAPHAGKNASEILDALTSREPIRIQDYPVDPAFNSFVDVCDRCLAKSTGDRWQSAKELADAIASATKKGAN